MPTIEEYQTLLREAEEKRAKVAELEEALARLQEELAILKGEEPPVHECPHCDLTFATQVELEAHVASEHPVAAEVVPWYKSWKTYLVLGGLGALIAGIGIVAVKKKVAKP